MEKIIWCARPQSIQTARADPKNDKTSTYILSEIVPQQNHWLFPTI